MIAYLSLLYHSPEGGVMAYLMEWMYLPLCVTHPPTAHPCNQHPPTAHPTSTLLQCMRSLCNSGCAHTVYASCEYPHYICTYVPVPQCHMGLYSNSLHTSSSLWHTYSTCKHTDMYMQSQTTPTKQRGRSSHSTHLGRQVGNQHVFITGLVILPKVNKWTVTLLPTVT